MTGLPTHLRSRLFGARRVGDGNQRDEHEQAVSLIGLSSPLSVGRLDSTHEWTRRPTASWRPCESLGSDEKCCPTGKIAAIRR